MRSHCGNEARSLLARVLALCCCLFLVASCGQGGQDVGKDAPIPVIVGAAANISEGPLFVADRAGLDKKHGVDLKVQLFDLGFQGVEAAMAGRTQGGVSVEFPMLLLLDKLKSPDKVVAPAVYQTSKGLKIVTDADIRKPEDLRGKTIGLPVGSSLDYAFQRYLEHFKLTDDVKIENVGSPEMIPSMDRGDIDGFVFADPVVSQALDKFGDEARVLEPGIETVYTTRVWLQFSRTWAEQNPKAVRGVLRALIDADKLLEKNPKKAHGLVGEQLSMSTKKVSDAMELGEYDWNVYVDDESIKAFDDVGTWMAQNDVIKTKPDYREAIDTSYLKKVSADRVRVSEQP